MRPLSIRNGRSRESFHRCWAIFESLHSIYFTRFTGSRIDKQWFMIRDSSLKTERLLTIVPLSGSPAYGCEVTTTDADATRNALIDLFTALQHP